METTTAMEKGQLSIHSENILPIIKKWLYSEKEIFIRELVSNAVDAINKLKHLSLMKEYEGDLPEPEIRIDIDEQKHLLKVSDNGLGMDAEEVKKYINQIAFSGAKDFINKYETAKSANQFIGHFGLGFYSSFMAANRVEIETLSYRKESTAVKWICDGGIEFEIGASERTTVGTTIILHVNDDSKEFLNDYKVREVLTKYCRFLPYPIYLNGKQENDPNPLWSRLPSECKDEDYKTFYHKLFPMAEDPLFWIHMNFDYPFNLKGILYFPKVDHNLMNTSKDRIHLYCNQVFVTDHCPELIPEFLTLIQGVIDSPDIPLNISRSFLQNDPTVKATSAHIIRKVADKLGELFRTERASYEKYWNDIAPFIKFGMMHEDKFAEKAKDFILFETVDGAFLTLPEYVEKRKPENSDPTKAVTTTVYYTADKKEQVSLIEMFRTQGIPVVVLDSMIDAHFTNFMEFRNQDIKFARIDSGVDEVFIDQAAKSTIIDPKDNKDVAQKIIDTFKKHLQNDQLEIKCESLKTENIPAFITVSEHMRRFGEISSLMQKKVTSLAEQHTLVVNSANPMVKKLVNSGILVSKDAEIKLICEHIYDLARINHKSLTAEQMAQFLQRSNDILNRMADGL